MQEKKRVCILLTEKEHDELKLMAIREHCSISKLISNLLAEKLMKSKS